MATLKEALESGKMHRIVGHKDWMPAYTPSPTNSGEIYWGAQVIKEWEIYEPEVTVTRRKLAEAWHRSLGLEVAPTSPYYPGINFDRLAKELGL